MNARVSTLLWLAAVSGGGLLAASSAHAGVFDDDEARKAVIQLRDQFNGFQATASQRIDQSSRAQLDMQNQLEGLRQEVARLRGQNEVLQNTVDTLQKQQKDYYADLDARLKKFEPQQVNVEGREGLAQPTEKPEYDAALKQFQSGDFKSAGTAFSAFAKKYPQSPYLPLAQFWIDLRPAEHDPAVPGPCEGAGRDDRRRQQPVRNRPEGGREENAGTSGGEVPRDRRRPGRQQQAEDAEVTDAVRESNPGARWYSRGLRETRAA
jgi:hypothetical protein